MAPDVSLWAPIPTLRDELELGLLSGPVERSAKARSRYQRCATPAGRRMSRESHDGSCHQSTISGLDVHVGRVAGNDADLLDRALSVQAKYSGQVVHAIFGPDEEQDRGVDLVRVDQQAEFVAGPVLLPVGDDLQVVESPVTEPSYPCPGDRDQVAPFDHMTPPIVDCRRQSIRAGGRRLDGVVGLTVGDRVSSPTSEWEFRPASAGHRTRSRAT